MIKLNPSEENIGTNEAKKWIENYKTRNGQNAAFLFSEDLIVRIIGQNDAVGFKIHLAYNDDNLLQLIMVGTREDGTEMWPLDTGKRESIGIGIPC